MPIIKMVPGQVNPGHDSADTVNVGKYTRRQKMCELTTIDVGNRTINVADNKREYIRNIIEAASKCDYIDRVVLFGSSITTRCTDESDIDLAVFGNKTKSKCLTSAKYKAFTHQLYEFNNYSQHYDILYFKSGKSNSSRIMGEIDNGEVIYER